MSLWLCEDPIVDPRDLEGFVPWTFEGRVFFSGRAQLQIGKRQDEWLIDVIVGYYIVYGVFVFVLSLSLSLSLYAYFAVVKPSSLWSSMPMFHC